MNIADYHAHPALGSTGIRALLKSPAHFKALKFGEPTPAQKLGTLVHTLVLEPETFAERYVVMPDGFTLHTKSAREEVAAIVESGRDWIKVRDYDHAKACAEAVLASEIGAMIKRSTRIEDTLLWDDVQTGVHCKARPDAVGKTRKGSPVLIDLKKTTDASAEGFPRSIANYGYHIQAAHYMSGAIANGMDVRGFLFIAVEFEPPYACAGYLLSKNAIAQGEQACLRAMDLYATCQSTGRWPGYNDDKITEIELPRWAQEMGQ